MDVDAAQATILRRAAWDEWEIPSSMLDFNERLFGERIGPEEVVRRILADIRQRGDTALVEWSERLDRVTPTTLVVTSQQIAAAYQQVDAALAVAMQLAAQRIETFHRRQPSLAWSHSDKEGLLGQLVRPIPRVGIYIPGGQAPLFSSLLMTAIPARVAGVPEVVVITPPQRDTGLPHPAVLVAADIAGVTTVYVGGGAQAIGALAFGTATIPKVDKICGPGNIFTTLAKRQVFGMVGIDGLPGPTETLVIADDGADPQLVAADLLAQAEHILACAILLTPSRAMAEQVQAAVMNQLEELEHTDELVSSLASGSGIVVTRDLPEAFDLANSYAPEHLCLLVDQPEQYLGRIQNAGGIFLGERSFEVLGDYVAGPSHVMPTGGTARFASPVNVNDFVKLISVIGLNETALQVTGPAAQQMAEAEGLFAHAAAVKRRLAE
ncbi:MAG: histidinol dehydrogenase [Caldilineaceae bacterium]|nr:histidinol dehydrogenase [Caldilineaceae bacterium]